MNIPRAGSSRAGGRMIKCIKPFKSCIPKRRATIWTHLHLDWTTQLLHTTGSFESRFRGQDRRGTAVDQWGWDSKEMWLPLISDSELMEDMAETWALPIAMGYLPPRYREHLAGGRLVALSKKPTQGLECAPSLSAMPNEDWWPKDCWNAARTLLPTKSKKHIQGLSNLWQTLRMEPLTCST